ncbi:unnamed protein product [Phytophthora fragariaefolia]|uniref:Unnamed protein product n=1 Tax=Phytophthora fragariaefolia TaxID=1490495 RepID=A0A9W6TV74_9STRA|nr:unnamed protein product [Phytophthora fragariaefolia]
MPHEGRLSPQDCLEIVRSRPATTRYSEYPTDAQPNSTRPNQGLAKGKVFIYDSSSSSYRLGIRVVAQTLVSLLPSGAGPCLMLQTFESGLRICRQLQPYMLGPHTNTKVSFYLRNIWLLADVSHTKPSDSRRSQPTHKISTGSCTFFIRPSSHQNNSMSLQDLAPANTKRALATTISTFGQFLVKEKVTREFVQASLMADSRGTAFVKLMDRFDLFLVSSNGKGGEPRKRNTVMSYYRNVKNWLLDLYSQHRNVIEQQGEFLSATAFFANTVSIRILKSNLSLSADNVLSIRLIRAKTSEEQGLSLFPDKDSFITWPINAVAMALAMQIFPSTSSLNLELSLTSEYTDLVVNIDQTPLVDVLLHCVDDSGHENLEPAAPTRRRRSTLLKLQGYVNKGAVADQEKANITANLSYRSFRRGGAQHANGGPTLSAQWIFDRENWSMTATTKTFAYVFNTTTEDRKVSKVLSNWKSSDEPKIPSLKEFDLVSTARIRQVGCKLFASSIGFEYKSPNIEGHVIDLLTATLIQHFPAVNDRYPMSPNASRMRTCLVSARIEMPDILAWSLVINRLASADGANHRLIKTLLLEKCNVLISRTS